MKRNARKKAREEEKKILEKLKQEEEALEKEVNEIMAEPKFSFKETIEMMKGEDEEEAEYRSYLTEEELALEDNKKKEERKIIKMVIIIFVITISAISFGSKVFYDTFKSDLLKITEPMLKSHYYDKMGQKAKTKTIEELETKGPDNKVIGTGIYLLTTKDNKHIMSLNNELIGDDINNSNKYTEVKEYLYSYFEGLELVTDDIKLSYDDYYVEFNRFLDYINVLPSDMSTEELINSKKLTVTYKALYQGELDYDLISSLLNTFSINSRFIFYKQTSTGITNIAIINKDKTTSLNITAEIEKDSGIMYLELDRNLNDVSDVEVATFADSSVSSKNDYSITNALGTKKIVERSRDEEIKDSYFLLRIDSSIINENNFIELSTSKRNDTYEELEKEDYIDTIVYTVGSYTYILSENNIFIGRTTTKKSFMCNFGIC